MSLRERFDAILVRPVMALLTQGATPERIALCIGLGLAIAICPILGVATLLCTVAAAALRLNLPLIQGVNYLAAPVQWILILPFIRAGEWMFGAERLPFSIPELLQRFDADAMGFIADFWKTGLLAAAAWLLTVPVVTGATYAVLVPVFRRLRLRRLASV